MTWWRIPVDSTDAREQREAEAAAAAETDRHDVQPHRAVPHDPRCRAGWLGEDTDGRPIPCTTCRPHLAHIACRTCSTTWPTCQALVHADHGPCCDLCDHHPAARGARR